MNIGVTLAVRQSSGIVELDNVLLKMKVRTGAISVAKYFSVRGSRASGPAALCGFRFSISLFNTRYCYCNFCICGYSTGSTEAGVTTGHSGSTSSAVEDSELFAYGSTMVGLGSLYVLLLQC